MRVWKSYSVDMSGLLRESWSMGWPMMLIMLFHFSIGMADVYVAGYLGTDILAAVGYVGQLYWTLMVVANGITVGAVSMISQAHGAKSSEGVSNITANAIMIGVVISGAFTAVAFLYPVDIVRIVGMPPGIREVAQNFLQIFALVLMPTYVMILTSGALRSSGRVFVAMMNSLAASLLNVVGDLVLGLGWFSPFAPLGYQGIAWASAAGTSFGMILNLIYIFRGPNRLGAKALLHPRSECIRNLVKLGIPSALQQTTWMAGTLVVYFLVGQIKGGDIIALAAMTAGARVEAIVFLPVFGLSMACSVLTGNRLGADDLEGSRAVTMTSVFLCFLITLFLSGAIFVFAQPIAGCLTADRETLDQTISYLRISMVGMPFVAVGLTLSGALQGAGDVMATLKIMFIGMWCLRIPFMLATIYVVRADASGVWWAMTLSGILMCGLLIGRFRGDAWTKASVDRTGKARLWEACIEGRPGRTKGSIPERGVDKGLVPASGREPGR